MKERGGERKGERKEMEREKWKTKKEVNTCRRRKWEGRGDG